MSKPSLKARTLWFPTYSDVRKLLPILNGVPKAKVTGMISSVWDHTGTPQSPVDWSNPDIWINDRLSGEDATLARRIWDESDFTINPRYISGPYSFINNYDLLLQDSSGVYYLSEKGRAFLDEDPIFVRELDDIEGLSKLLEILAAKSRAKRADLLPEWGEFLHEYSNFGSSSTVKSTLRVRLANLVEREFVAREGQYYIITPQGIKYAMDSSGTELKPKYKVLRAITAYNDTQKKSLKDSLGKMDPYRFEQLICELLESMGYDDVQVTKASNDKGVDVVAKVQFGITNITEVIQVKRHQGSIGRPILDQLRGALPYHKAIRGTLITAGNFSKGCKDAALFPGAAPIGLIDGDRLLDLLFEHRIGIKESSATIYEIDENYFSESQEEEVESR